MAVTCAVTAIPTEHGCSSTAAAATIATHGATPTSSTTVSPALLAICGKLETQQLAWLTHKRNP